MRKLRELVDALLLPFCKLEQIQFAAPWRQSDRRC